MHGSPGMHLLQWLTRYTAGCLQQSKQVKTIFSTWTSQQRFIQGPNISMHTDEDDEMWVGSLGRREGSSDESARGHVRFPLTPPE